MQRQTVLLRATKQDNLWLLHVQHLQTQTEHRFHTLESLYAWLHQMFPEDQAPQKTRSSQ